MFANLAPVHVRQLVENLETRTRFCIADLLWYRAAEQPEWTNLLYGTVAIDELHRSGLPGRKFSLMRIEIDGEDIEERDRQRKLLFMICVEYRGRCDALEAKLYLPDSGDKLWQRHLPRPN